MQNLRRNSSQLVFLSLSILFLELALIRWVGGQVRVVAYFPNLILIAIFFGLGLGSLISRKKLYVFWFPLALALVVSISIVLSKVIIRQGNGSEYFWLLYYNLPKDAPSIDNIQIPLLLFFSLITLTFIPLGQQLAAYLIQFKESGRTLSGYAYDLVGSLAGVILFTAISFLQLPPVYWFLFGSLFFLLGLDSSFMKKGIIAVLLGIVCFSIQYFDDNDSYSPYYALKRNGNHVLTNGSLHQMMVSLDPEVGFHSERHKGIYEGFTYPFTLLEGKYVESAVVFGAGTGNDVQILRQNGVKRIVAVEIDPMIQEIGAQYHPNRPYDDPNVEVVINDARSFINTCDEKFDLVLFGTLDSMTRLSALSNVRLDNYVYTQESIKQAQGLLNSNGGMVLHFRSTRNYIHYRMVSIVSLAFGELPIVKMGEYHLFNLSIMAGPLFDRAPPEGRQFAASIINAHHEDNLTLPSDNWPFLYLKERSINSFYLSMIAGILLIGGLMLILISGEFRESLFTRNPRIDSVMLLFGLSFLLLNTKSVTEMGLIWGNTWLVNSIVFASILFVILISTLVCQKKAMNLKHAYAGLFLSILILYFIPTGHLSTLPNIPKLFASVCYIALPFYFAGMCFANAFKTRANPEQAFGWNVIGALLGGLLEFTNMILGLKALFVVSLLVYFIAFLIESEVFRKRWKFLKNEMGAKSLENADVLMNEE